MRGLSLWNPWPYAILHLEKQFENRSWPGCYYRGPLALHASKTMRLAYAGRTVREWMSAGLADEEDLAELIGEQAVGSRSELKEVELGRLLAQALPRGAIVGVVDVIDWVATLDQVFEKYAGFERRWYWGGGALVLDNVRPLSKPIPCRGALGLWVVPPDVRKQIDEQLGEAA